MTFTNRLAAFLASSVLLPAALTLSGCGGTPAAGTGSAGGPPGLASGGASSIYILNTPATGSEQVLQFAAGANGAVSPTSTLTLPLSFAATAITTDSTGQIYVAGSGPGSNTYYQLLVYAANATGVATPLRTIQLTQSLYGADIPFALSTDAAGSLYVVGFGGDITVYAATANGAATPVRTISGTLTTLANNYPLSVAFDTAGNMYVANSNYAATGGSVLEFAAGANGNVAPTRTILLNNLFPYGVVVDSSGNIYVSENNSSGLTPAFIAEFGPTATGAAVPAKTITLSGVTPSELGAIRIDSVNNLYALLDTEVGSGATATASFSVVGIGPAETGVEAPSTQFTSTAIAYPSPQIAIH